MGGSLKVVFADFSNERFQWKVYAFRSFMLIIFLFFEHIQVCGKFY